MITTCLRLPRAILVRHQLPTVYRQPSTILLVLAATLALASAASAAMLCDQFSNITPMSGGGFAVTPDGEINGCGAVQINVPVAYVPRAHYIVATAALGGTASTNKDLNNGTGVIGGALGGFPRIWLSAMMVSRFQTTANAQVYLVQECKNVPGVAVGVQAINRVDSCKAWPFGVLTKRVVLRNVPLYVTAGIRGNGDSAGGIAGISVPLYQWANLATEWDGYQFNIGLALRPANSQNVTFLIARDSKSGWLAAGNLAFDISPRHH